MKIILSLSAKADVNGRKQIMMRFSPKIGERRLNMRAKSEIFVDEDFFDAAQDSGINPKMVSAKRIPTPEVLFHREQANKMLQLLQAVTIQFEEADKNRMKNEWFADAVRNTLHPKSDEADNILRGAFAALSKEYLNYKDLTPQVQKNFQVMFRAVGRYEGFVRAIQPERKDFTFNVATVTSEDITDFRDYMANEKELSDEYPHVFANLLQQYPIRNLGSRGGNYVFDMMKRLRTFFIWCNQVKKIPNRPFDGVQLESAKYGTPYYITIDERKLLASTIMPTPHLETQRDIFVFQCLIGCRVSDLTTLTENNISNGMLVYTPQKTMESTAKQARVPLLEEAASLISKYRGTDRQGRLFPFISDQQYNKAIKEVFTLAGITRKVEVRNPLTGKMEFRPINEIASSHMARRTFVGNLYFNTQDPNLIGKMSGHKEGSRAFSRYRKIEDETLADVMNTIK